MSDITTFYDDEDYDEKVLSYKIIFIGDSAVGKTSFIVRFCDDTFYDNSLCTIGIDTKTKYVSFHGQKIELEIWDTAGQERFKSLTKNSYQGADGIILMYDITQKKTFKNIKNWYNNIKESIDISQVALIIVGNKIDEPNVEVTKDVAEKFCEQYNIQLIETSCKENINIQETFNSLIEKMMQLDSTQKQEKKTRQSKLIDYGISNYIKKKRKCCH